MQARVQHFFDSASSTFTYVVYESDGSACAIIDPVLNYDARSGRLSSDAAERVIEFVTARRLTVQWLLETHAHADHLSGAAFLRQRLGGKIAISARITEVQQAFRHTFNFEPEFRLDGAQFDHLFGADEAFQIGALPAVAMQVPGHTPADIAYRIGSDAVFVGDTMMMPDVGSARCDFPGGSALMLYRSIQRILSLAPETRLFVCHDYPPANSEGKPPRPVSCESSVGEQRKYNIHVRDGIGEAEFIVTRTRRDTTLDLPALMLPSIQVNLRGGSLPSAEDNGVRYLKIPLDLL
ncbi:MAG TPA: MBL fold metallo-hydrolase [Janthinobacterium sp.]|jgi:glyoxylase-like metal-dependent hydrolase (beta-lactamase superfamily II)|nr:MBL fold metallo-hydrolase [Janthinobacterium sp.]